MEPALCCAYSQLARPSIQMPPTRESLRVGERLTCYVQRVDRNGLWVYVAPSMRGFVYRLETGVDPTAIADLAAHYKLYDAIQCRVLSVEATGSRLDLTRRDLPIVPPGKLLFPVGSLVAGCIVKKMPGTGLLLRIARNTMGRVWITDLADSFIDDPLSAYHEGDVVRAVVVASDDAGERIDLSMRASRLSPGAQEWALRDPEIASVSDLKNDMVVRGYVQDVAKVGVFVTLGRAIIGRVLITNLSDKYIADWQSAYRVGQLVRARVLSADPSENHVNLSLRLSHTDPDKFQKQLSWHNLKAGDVVTGSVSRVEPYGVFILLNHTIGRIVGLCHISEMADARTTEDATTLYDVGDAVKAIVLSADADKRRLRLGLKPSYFAHATDAECRDVAEGASAALDAAAIPVAPADADEAGETAVADGVAPTTSAAPPGPLTPLDVHAGFDWGATALTAPQPLAASATGPAPPDDESGSEHDADAGPADETPAERRRHRRAAKAMRRLQAEAITRAENSLLDPDREPATAEDYDRLVLSTPRNSFAWVKYMAFHLSLAEVDAARAVTERALKAIPHTDQQERMNIWVALMNLENRYGTAASLQAAFERALAEAVQKHVYLQLAAIYERSEKFEVRLHAARRLRHTRSGQLTPVAGQLADELYRVMCRKFKQSKKVWIQWGHYKMRRGQLDGARSVLNRSLQSLPKRKRAWCRYRSAAAPAIGSRRRARRTMRVQTWPRLPSLRKWSSSWASLSAVEPSSRAF